MDTFTVLPRYGNCSKEFIDDLRALEKKHPGVVRLRLKVIPANEHWLVYHCRFRKGLAMFARYLVRLDQELVRAGQTAASDALPVEWPNEERRNAVGRMISIFLESYSGIRYDLGFPQGAYQRDAACDKLRDLLRQIKLELVKEYEETDADIAAAVKTPF